MGVGRRQKTEAERRRDGSRKRPRHHPQPSIVPGEPIKPRHLSKVASAQWEILVSILRKEERLTEADGQQVENAAHLYATAVRWQRVSDRAPMLVKIEHPQADNGVWIEEKPHPAHQQARLAWDTYRKACAELGITQTSRSRAKGTTGANEKPEPTPLEKLRAARAEQRNLRAV
jgi:P27 family predicted phage terminase small subunit